MGSRSGAVSREYHQQKLEAATARAEKAEARGAQLEEALTTLRSSVAAVSRGGSIVTSIALGSGIAHADAALSTPPSDWLREHDRELVTRAVKAGDDNVEGADARKIRPLSEVVEEVLRGK